MTEISSLKECSLKEWEVELWEKLGHVLVHGVDVRSISASSGTLFASVFYMKCLDPSTMPEAWWMSASSFIVFCRMAALWIDM